MSFIIFFLILEIIYNLIWKNIFILNYFIYMII